MASFRYTGRNHQGERVSGSLQGNSADAVASELVAQRITPLQIEEETASGGDDAMAWLAERLRKRSVDLEELIIFCRQMYSLTKAGVPIIRVGVMRPDGSGERLLTDSWQDEAPTWAPNGRVIQFFRTERNSGKTSVWQVDLTGRNERKLPTPVDGSDPAWGPVLP